MIIFGWICQGTRCARTLTYGMGCKPGVIDDQPSTLRHHGAAGVYHRRVPSSDTKENSQKPHMFHSLIRKLL